MAQSPSELVSGEDVLRFHRDGFIILRNVLSPSEVEKLRSSIEAAARKAKDLGQVLRSVTGEIVPVTDIMGMPGVGWLLSDERLVAVARKLIGRDDVVYFGDSGVMLGGRLRGFHKDNTVRDDAAHDDWQSPYTLIRMGLYLQDHARYSGGLKVRRTSHLHADVTSGQIVDVPTRAGDLVAWSLRTTHSGHAIRVRGLPFLRLQPRMEARLPSWLGVPEPCERVAAFITFGADDAHLRNYIAKHTDLTSYPNNYLYQSWLHSDGSAEGEKRLAAAGVRFVKPIAEYGARFGTSERVPEGFIATGAARPDVYVPRGVEAFIQRSGRALRSLGLA